MPLCRFDPKLSPVHRISGLNQGYLGLSINNKIKTWSSGCLLRISNRGYMCVIEQTGTTHFA